MDDLDLGVIIDFLKEDYWTIKDVIKWFKPSHEDKAHWEEYRPLFLELQKIKDQFLTGKVFVKNQTKGNRQRRGRSLFASIIKDKLEKNQIEEARMNYEFALDHLKLVYSERTVYRFKKEVKELFEKHEISL